MCCLVAALGITLQGVAQQPVRKEAQKQVETVVFKTDIHCEECADKILTNVPVLGRGVKDVQVDVPTKEVTIRYDHTKTTREELVKGLAKLRVKAEEKKN